MLSLTTEATTTPATTGYRLHSNKQIWNSHGQDIGVPRRGTRPETCIGICDALDTCKGFNVNQSATTCIIRSNVVDNTREGSSFNLYTKNADSGTYTSRYNYTKYTDKVKMGGANGGVISGYEDRETNLTGCKALCESLDDCIGFVMDKSQTNCWVKNSLSNMIDDTEFDTYRKGFERTLIQF